MPARNLQRQDERHGQKPPDANCQPDLHSPNGGALPPEAPELVRLCLTKFAEEYVQHARAGWTAQTKLTAGAVDGTLSRLEAEMPDRLAGDLATRIVRLITGAALLAPAA